MLELAGCGLVPGAKIGRDWIFVASDVQEYLREEIMRQTAERRLATSEKQKRLKDAHRPGAFAPISEIPPPPASNRRSKVPPPLPEFAG